ncbi:hypothetical protein ABZX40_13435 [Streptomyces sp. NPDC004610]|uniref:hypothetical protein n=1 Tax=unclassified Streptomyces TaxID=2593676 RepID=UPI0033A5C55F
MGRIRDFMRTLAPVDDRRLAAELRGQRRERHRDQIPNTARDADRWEQQDRARDRHGNRHTDWTR